jgi:hypothetical protein
MRIIAEQIHGSSYGSPDTKSSPVSMDELEELKVSFGFTERNGCYLRVAGEVLTATDWGR